MSASVPPLSARLDIRVLETPSEDMRVGGRREGSDEVTMMISPMGRGGRGSDEAMALHPNLTREGGGGRRAIR